MYHTQKSKVNIVSVNIVAGSLIALCVLILSYTHTTALFDRAGYTGIFAHIGVIGFEMTFILGTVTVIWSKWIGQKIAVSSRFVFALGVIVNLYSNITSGIAKNGQPLVFWIIKGIAIDEAVLIGALIPLLIVSAEMVVQDAIFKHRASQEGEQTLERTEELIDNEVLVDEVSDKIIESENEILQTVETVETEIAIDEPIEIGQPSTELVEEDQTEVESKQSKRSSKQTKEVARAVAQAHFLQTGEHLSVRDLADKVDCSRYMAQKVINSLKAESDSESDVEVSEVVEELEEEIQQTA